MVGCFLALTEACCCGPGVAAFCFATCFGLAGLLSLHTRYLSCLPCSGKGVFCAKCSRAFLCCSCMQAASAGRTVELALQWHTAAAARLPWGAGRHPLARTPPRTQRRPLRSWAFCQRSAWMTVAALTPAAPRLCHGPTSCKRSKRPPAASQKEMQTACCQQRALNAGRTQQQHWAIKCVHKHARSAARLAQRLQGCLSRWLCVGLIVVVVVVCHRARPGAPLCCSACRAGCLTPRCPSPCRPTGLECCQAWAGKLGQWHAPEFAAASASSACLGRPPAAEDPVGRRHPALVPGRAQPPERAVHAPPDYPPWCPPTRPW